jgi:hypothetical protein
MTFIVGVTLVTPVAAEATALNMLVAAVWELARDCVIMVGVTAASAAASAAALSFERFCMAPEKSRPIPIRKIAGTSASAKVIATLPARSRKNRRNKSAGITLSYWADREISGRPPARQIAERP